MKSMFQKLAAVTAVVGLLAGAAIARAENLEGPVPPDRAAVAPSTAALFSSGGLGRTGDFSGTIVDLSCDSYGRHAAKDRCEPGDHSYALELDGERVVYPLLVLGDTPSTEQLRAGEFTGKQVRVAGVRYSSNGTILVSAIYPRR